LINNNNISISNINNKSNKEIEQLKEDEMKMEKRIQELEKILSSFIDIDK
jgi:hypothetical protein